MERTTDSAAKVRDTVADAEEGSSVPHDTGRSEAATRGGQAGGETVDEERAHKALQELEQQFNEMEKELTDSSSSTPMDIGMAKGTREEGHKEELTTERMSELQGENERLKQELASSKAQLSVLLRAHVEGIDSKVEVEHLAMLRKMKEILAEMGEERSFYQQKIGHLRDALEKQQARNDEVEKKVRRILELVKAEKVQIYKKVKEQFQSFRAEIKEARKKDREITELKMKLAELEEHARDDALRFAMLEREREELLSHIAQGTRPAATPTRESESPRDTESQSPRIAGGDSSDGPSNMRSIFLGSARSMPPTSIRRRSMEQNAQRERDGPEIDRQKSTDSTQSTESGACDDGGSESSEAEDELSSSAPTSCIISKDGSRLSSNPMPVGSETSSSTSPLSASASPASPTISPVAHFSPPMSEGSMSPPSAVVKTSDPRQSAVAAQTTYTTTTEIIAQLTADKAPRPEFVCCILSTYRLFSQGHDFWELLRKKYLDSKSHIIAQIRVANVIKHWAEHHAEDILGDEQLVAKLEDFISAELSVSYAAVSNRIVDILSNRRKSSNEARALMATLLPEKSAEPLVTEEQLLEMVPGDVGKQLTLIDFGRMRLITTKELTSLKWASMDKEEAMRFAGNIVLHTQQFNRVSNWVSACIVKHKKRETRVRVIEWFLQLLKSLLKFRNFHTMYAVMAGLTSTPVYRLKLTWAGVEASLREVLQEVKELTSPSSNFKQLRNAAENAKPPFLPYIGTFLTDITFILNGSSDDPSLVNVSKFMRVGKVLKKLDQCRRYQFHFVPVPSIALYLARYETLDEETLFQQSKECEGGGGASGIGSMVKTDGR